MLHVKKGGFRGSPCVTPLPLASVIRTPHVCREGWPGCRDTDASQETLERAVCNPLQVRAPRADVPREWAGLLFTSAVNPTAGHVVLGVAAEPSSRAVEQYSVQRPPESGVPPSPGHPPCRPCACIALHFGSQPRRWPCSPRSCVAQDTYWCHTVSAFTAFSPNRIGEYDSYSRIYCCTNWCTVHVGSGTVTVIVLGQRPDRQGTG